MENVLSKKVRRFLAFALAFVLAVPSLPASMVYATELAKDDGVILAYSSGTGIGQSVKIDTINLVKDGVVTIYGSATTASSAGAGAHAWSSSDTKKTIGWDAPTGSSAQVTGREAGSATITYTASSAEGDTAYAGKASAAVHTYGIGSGTSKASASLSSNVQFIGTKAGMTAAGVTPTQVPVKYVFGYNDGDDVKSSANNLQWSIVDNAGNASADFGTFGTGDKAGEFTPAASAGAGKIKVRATDSVLFANVKDTSGSAANFAEANLTITDVSTDMALYNGNKKVAYGDTVYIPTNSSAVFYASATTANNIASSATVMGNNANYNGTYMTSSAYAGAFTGSAQKLLISGESVEESSNEDVTFYASGTVNGDGSVIGAMKKNIVVEPEMEAKLETTGDINAIDVHGSAEASKINLALNFDGLKSYAQNGIAIGNEITSAEIDQEGLYINRGSGDWKIFFVNTDESETASAASDWLSSTAKGSANRAITINHGDQEKSSAGSYVARVYFDVDSVVAGAGSKNYKAATYSSAAYAEFPFTVVKLVESSGETLKSLTYSSAEGYYTKTVTINENVENSDTVVLRLAGVPEEDASNVSWTVSDEAYATISAATGSEITVTGKKKTADSKEVLVTATYKGASVKCRIIVKDESETITVVDNKTPTHTFGADNKDIALSVGDSLTLTMQVNDSSGYLATSGSASSASVEDSSVVTLTDTNLTTQGEITLTGVAEGTTTLTITRKQNGKDISGTLTLNLIVSKNEVTVTPTNLYLPIFGQEGTIEAVSGDGKAIDWGSSASIGSASTDIIKSASYGTLNNKGDNGLLTVVSGSAAGKATFSASAGAVWTDATVRVFGLQGTKNGSAVADFTYGNADKTGHYSTTLNYVEDAAGRSYGDSMKLKLFGGSDLDVSKNGTITIVSSNPKAVTVDETSMKITAVGEGKSTITVTYDNSEATESEDAVVALKLDVTVYNWSFALADLSSVKLAKNSSAYAIKPVVVPVSKEEVVTKNINTFVSYTFALTEPSGYKDSSGTVAAVSSSGEVSSNGRLTNSDDPYKVSITAKFSGNGLDTITSATTGIALGEFDFYVVGDNVQLDKTAMRQSYFFGTTSAENQINLVKSSADSSDFVIAKGSSTATASSGSATAVLNGTTITVYPGAGSAEAFEIYVGDVTKGEATQSGITNANNLGTLFVNIVGVTNPDMGNVSAYDYNLYLTSSTKAAGETRNITIGANGAFKLETSAWDSKTEYLSNNTSFISWETSNSDAVSADLVSGTSITGKLTAKKEGTSRVTATLKTFNTSTPSGDSTVLNSLSVPINVKVVDLSSVTVNGYDDLTLGTSSANAASFAPSLSKDVGDVNWTFQVTGAAKFVDMSVGTTTKGSAIAATTLSDGRSSVDVYSDTAGKGTLKMTASVTDSNGTVMSIGSTTVNLVFVKSGADSVVTAKTAASGAKVNDNEIIAATNLAGGNKTSGVTLADLTDSTNGLYSFVNEYWDWAQPKTRLDTLGKSSGQAVVDVVYKNGSYEEYGAVTLDLITIDGLLAKANVSGDAAATEGKKEWSFNTSGSTVKVTEMAFVDENGDKNTDAGTWMKAFYDNYVGTFKLTTPALIFGDPTVKGTGNVIDLSKLKYTAGTNAFDIGVSTSVFGKATVTVTGLGFSTSFAINNVAKLSVMGKPVLTTTTAIRKGSEAGYTDDYYMEWSGTADSTTLSVAATNVTEVSLKSSNTKVATVEKKMTGSGTFSSTIRLVGPGLTTITATAADSVKSTSSVNIYVVQKGAQIAPVELDPNMTYGAATEANVIDVIFNGAGYDLNGAPVLKSQKNAAGTSVAYFSETIPASTTWSGGYCVTYASKPAEGTYTLTFNIPVKNILSGETATIEGVEMKAVVKAVAFKASSFSVKQTAKPNFFYYGETAALTFSCKEAGIGAVSLTNGYYEIANNGVVTDGNKTTIDAPAGGVVYVKLKNGVNTDAAIKAAIKGDGKKLSFTITPSGYANSVTKVVSVNSTYKAPTLTATPKSATVFKNLSANLGQGFEVSVTHKDTGISEVKANYDLYDKNLTIGIVTNDKNHTKLYQGNASDILTFGESGDGINYYWIEATKNASGNIKAAISFQDQNTGNRLFQARDLMVLAPVTVKVDAKTTKVKLAASNTKIELNSQSTFVGKEAGYTEVYVNGGTYLSEAASRKLTIAGANSKSQAIASSLDIQQGYSDADEFEKLAENATDGYGGIFRIALKNPVAKGSYKFKISCGAVESTPVTITVNVTDKAPTVTVKNSGSITLIEDTELALVPTFKGISGTVTGVGVAGTSQTLFNIDEGDEPGVSTGSKKIKSTLKMDVKKAENYSLKQKYSVVPVYTIELDSGATIQLSPVKPITFKLKSPKISATVNPTQPQAAVGSARKYKVAATYTVKTQKPVSVTGLTIDKNGGVTLTDPVFQDVDGDGFKIAIGTVTPASGGPGKTLTVKLKVGIDGVTSDTKPVYVTMKVKIPKAK